MVCANYINIGVHDIYQQQTLNIEIGELFYRNAVAGFAQDNIEITIYEGNLYVFGFISKFFWMLCTLRIL